MVETIVFFETLIQECRNWLRRIWVVNIYHIYREGNIMANSMANRAFNLQQVVLKRRSNPPEELKSHLVQDAAGCVLERTVSH